MAHTNWKAERRKRRRAAAAPVTPPITPTVPLTTAYASPGYGSPGGYAETPGNVDLGMAWNPAPPPLPTSEPYAQGNAWQPTKTLHDAVRNARHRQGHGGGGSGHHGGQGGGQGLSQGGGQGLGQGQQYQPQAVGQGRGRGGRGPNWIQQRVRDRLGR